MQAYVYQATLLCADCGRAMRIELRLAGLAPEDESDESTYDSYQFPKGPVADGGGESDVSQHCDHCGVALGNPVIGTQGGSE